MTDNTTPNLTLDEPAAPSLTLEQQAPAAPGLTLDAAPEQQAEQPAEAPKPLDADAMAEESGLSPEEKQQVEDFAKKIDLSNSTQILNTARPARKRWRIFPPLRWRISARKTWARWATWSPASSPS